MQFKELLVDNFEFHSFGPKIDMQDVTKIELLINAKLPEQYREYLLYSNGGVVINRAKKSGHGYMALVKWPEGSNLHENDQAYYHFETFFRYDPGLNEDDVAYTETLKYNYETFKLDIPESTLPIARTPGGDLFLIGFGQENNGKIYYWGFEKGAPVHVDENGDVYTLAFLGFVADSLVEFILGLKPIKGE